MKNLILTKKAVNRRPFCVTDGKDITVQNPKLNLTDDNYLG